MQVRPATPEDLPAIHAIYAHHVRKGLASFENEPVNAPLAEIANSEVILRFILDVVPSAEPDAWLRKQQRAGKTVDLKVYSALFFATQAK